MNTLNPLLSGVLTPYRPVFISLYLFFCNYLLITSFVAQNNVFLLMAKWLVYCLFMVKAVAGLARLRWRIIQDAWDRSEWSVAGCLQQGWQTMTAWRPLLHLCLLPPPWNCGMLVFTANLMNMFSYGIMLAREWVTAALSLNRGKKQVCTVLL